MNVYLVEERGGEEGRVEGTHTEKNCDHTVMGVDKMKRVLIRRQFSLHTFSCYLL